MTALGTPAADREAVTAFVARHLGHLACDEIRGSDAIAGGQHAADRALREFDVAGYRTRRTTVAPQADRGASQLSPYIRHGLLHLSEVWEHVQGGPAADVAKFRDELLWQEFARHWYARLGAATASDLRFRVGSSAPARSQGDGWPTEMNCITSPLAELHRDGWVVNQARMWLAAGWTTRSHQTWQSGEEHFFRHLLDGSRAANRLGWQWTAGTASAKPYELTRAKVLRQAPAYCAGCELQNRCPIEDPADPPPMDPVPTWQDRIAGSAKNSVSATMSVETLRRPEAIWLTAESLGTSDPALVAHPDLPVVFVFDEPLLRRLRLSSKRLVFLVETLAELARRRVVEIRVGEPAVELRDRQVAVTAAPVPGFARRARDVEPAELHPWPWLRPPNDAPISSFSAWRRHHDRSS